MMTQEMFFEYLYDVTMMDGDKVISVEYNENSFSYFGVFNPDLDYGGPYKLYAINETGDCVSVCESTCQEWQTYKWPNASYKEYLKYIAGQE